MGNKVMGLVGVCQGPSGNVIFPEQKIVQIPSPRINDVVPLTEWYNN